MIFFCKIPHSTPSKLIVLSLTKFSLIWFDSVSIKFDFNPLSVYKQIAEDIEGTECVKMKGGSLTLTHPLDGLEKHQKVNSSCLQFCHIVLRNIYIMLFSKSFYLMFLCLLFFRHNLLDSKINTLLSLCQDPNLLNPIHGIVQSVVYHEESPPQYQTSYLQSN